MSEHRLRLRPGVGAAVRRHGETYPHELWGAGRRARPATAGRHAAEILTEEGPRRRFLVRPSDYRLAEQRATELGGDLLGFIILSRSSRAAVAVRSRSCVADLRMMIVAVAAGTARVMTCGLKEDRTSFEEGELNGDENPDSDACSIYG